MNNPPEEMSHDDLVKRASAWLANSMRCPVVITEMAGMVEEPDAIGWGSGGGSILVECKTTKSDFNADKWKAGRRTPARFGMGNRRYYLVEKHLLDHVLLNKPEQWGVLLAYKTRIEMRAKADWIIDANKTREMGLLILSLRRLAGEKQPLAGMSVKYYEIDGPNNPKATIGIE